MSCWAFAEWRRAVRVSDHVEKTVVFLGRRTPFDQFIPYGTAFLGGNIMDSELFQTIITARHVIDLFGDNDIHIRINKLDGSFHTETTKKQWWYSPVADADLAICPGRFHPSQFDILHVDLDHIVDSTNISELEIGLGEDIFICGMYLSRIGESRNLPIVRSGTIAAMPSERIRTSYGYHHAFLIEARSTGGLSGSPCFFQLPPFRFVNANLRTAANRFAQYFMGMVLGHNKLTFPPEVIPFLPPDERSGEEKKEDEVERSLPLNTGIAIVLPASYILEAVTDGDFVQMRREAIERRRRRSGYTPDSSIPVVGPESEPTSIPVGDDQNPNNREDFTALVSVASKRKPKGDRT